VFFDNFELIEELVWLLTQVDSEQLSEKVLEKEEISLILIKDISSKPSILSESYSLDSSKNIIEGSRSP